MKDLTGKMVDLKSLKRYDIVYHNDFILVYAGKSKHGTPLYEVVYDLNNGQLSGSTDGVDLLTKPKNYIPFNKGLMWGYDGFEDDCVLLERLNGKRPLLGYIIDSYSSYTTSK